MTSIIYLIGLVVLVVFILNYFGLRQLRHLRHRISTSRSSWKAPSPARTNFGAFCGLPRSLSGGFGRYILSAPVSAFLAPPAFLRITPTICLPAGWAPA